MIFERNGVYARERGTTAGLFRVLEATHESIFLIRVDGGHESWISITPEQAKHEKWTFADDPWLGLRAQDDEDLSPFQIQTRNRAYHAIQLLLAKARRDCVAHGVSATQLLLYFSHYARLTKEVAKELKLPLQTIRRWLKRWWTRGMCRNACLPDVETMSGKGKHRAISADLCDGDGWPTNPIINHGIGRKPKHRVGIRMTEPIRNSILARGKEIYFANEKFSVNDAFVRWKDECVKVDGRSPHPATFTQILGSDPEVKDEIQRRHLFGRKKKEKPPIADTTSARVPGPGFRFQLDASPLPVPILNAATGEVGRKATLTWAIDTKVKGIAGFHVSGTPECAQSACGALLHATQPKVAYCAKRKIKIDRSWWPMETLPEEVVHDRGPWVGPAADILTEVFGVSIDNTPAYSPQLKADVEAAFGALLRKVFSKLDEYLPPRAGRKLGADGTCPPLTIYEIEVLIIWFILEYNSRPLDRVPTPNEVNQAIKTTPVGLWNSEAHSLRGNGKKLSDEEARLVLTKRGRAYVDRGGLVFEGLRYTSSNPEVKSLMSKLGDKSRSGKIRYHDDFTDHIFVQLKELRRLGATATKEKPFRFVECVLHAESAEWAGHTFPMVREAFQKHLQAMAPAVDAHEKFAAKRLDAVQQKTTYSQIGDKSEGTRSVPEVAATIEAQAADERIAGRSTATPTTDKSSSSASKSADHPPVPTIPSKVLASLRAARAANRKSVQLT